MLGAQDLRSQISDLKYVVRRSQHKLEGQSHRQLNLPRIANTLSQEPVEVKQAWRSKWIDIVGVVEGIEHLEHRNDREAFVQFDRPLDSPIKREILIVFAQSVAVSSSSHCRRDRLSRASLNAEVSIKSPAQVNEGEEVELVTNIAI